MTKTKRITATATDRRAIQDLADQDVANPEVDGYATHRDAERAIRLWRASAKDAGDRECVELIDRVGVTAAAKIYEAARAR